MAVLVTYATRHGSTAGIAERIGSTLQQAGVVVEVRPVGEVGDLAGYDGVVIGAAAYMFHWLKDATAFVRRHRRELSAMPVWLFSSGPLGTDLVDAEGRDVVVASRPKEFDEFVRDLHPRGERIFFGAWDPQAPPVGLAERMMRAVPAGKEALPPGDFRDWEAIDAWAAEIADELTGVG